MFSNKEENGIDFCDSYRSQILSTEEVESRSSLFGTFVKLLTIVLLVVTIGGVSFYGYHNFMKTNSSNGMSLPPQSTQISDDDLVVTLEEEPKSEKVEPQAITSQVVKNKEENIEEVANSVKIAIAKSESKEEKVKEEELDVPTSAPEAEYLEELADLSKEIDKERK